MEALHDLWGIPLDFWEGRHPVPLRRPGPADAGSGREAYQPVPGGPLHSFQGACHQGVTALSTQHSGVRTVSGMGVMWDSQGKGWEYSSPLAASGGRFQVKDIPDARTEVVGLGAHDSGLVRKGKIFSVGTLGALKGADLAHMALSAAAMGTQPGDELAPLVGTIKEEDDKDRAVDPLGGMGRGAVGQEFPYLQLTPPHCRLCRCLGARTLPSKTIHELHSDLL